MAGPSKLNQNENIPIVNLNLSQLLFVANAATGKGGKNTLGALANLILANSNTPVRSYTDINELLNNNNLLSNFFAYVGDATDDSRLNEGWAIYFYPGGDKTTLSTYLLISGENIGDAFSGILALTDSKIDLSSTSSFTDETGELLIDPDNSDFIIALGSKYPAGTPVQVRIYNSVNPGVILHGGGLYIGSNFPNDGTIDPHPGTITLEAVDDTLFDSYSPPNAGFIVTNGDDLFFIDQNGNKYTLSAQSNFLGLYTSLSNLESAHPTASPGNYAFVDPGSGTEALLYIWDEDEGWIASGVTTVVPDASETVKGIIRIADQTKSETAADTTEVNRDHEDSITARGFRWAFDAVWTWLKSQASEMTSLLNALGVNLDLVSVSISSGTLTLDLDGKRQRCFKLSSAASSNFTIALSNTSNVRIFTLDLEITGNVNITMPSTVRMSQAESDINNRWNSSTNTLTLSGDTASPFELSFSFDGSIYKLKASQKYI